MKVAVIGAGASGLMASGLMAKNGIEVDCFDHNEKVGKKLFITGKGRCNLTNFCDEEEMLRNVVRGDKFLRSAIHNFTPADTISLFESLGLKTKVERGNRVFPESDKSSDVIKALMSLCENVNFKLDQNVTTAYKNGDMFVVVANGKKYEYDKLVIATGGLSYKGTGSDGSGYNIARRFGHTIVDAVPALCPIALKNVESLKGVSLKNVTLKCRYDGGHKELFGEMLFTDHGISGPIVLSMSSYINRSTGVELSLDLKPALTIEQLDARLLREFDENKNKNIYYIFKGLLISSLITSFSALVDIPVTKKVHDITKEERKRIIEGLKNFPLEFDGFYDIDTGIITSGGVSTKEVNPKTYESKLVPNLYFAGEVLDVDALTGGFNLQIAFATGNAVAMGIINNL